MIITKNWAANYIEIVSEDAPTVSRLVDGFPNLEQLLSFDRTRVVGYRIYGRQEPAPATADYAELCRRIRANRSQFNADDREALEAADAIEALSAQLADARAKALEEAASGKTLSFENGDWFWDADDHDISDENPYNVVFEQPFGVIVHVKGSIHAGSKFGFLLEPLPDAETSDPREFWFNTREEAEAARAGALAEEQKA